MAIDSSTTMPEDDWLADPEEEMLAEDERWAATLERHQERFAALEEDARNEINSNLTEPMFTEDGEMSLP